MVEKGKLQVKPTIHKPHDSLFRDFLIDIKMAKTFFRFICQKI